MMSKLMMVMALVLAAGVAAAQGVLINEVDADTESTDILEFVELFGEQAPDLVGEHSSALRCGQGQREHMGRGQRRGGYERRAGVGGARRAGTVGVQGRLLESRVHATVACVVRLRLSR